MSFRYNDLPANRAVLWREGVPINLSALHEHFFIRPLADHFFLTHPTVFDTRYAQGHLPVREQSAAVVTPSARCFFIPAWRTSLMRAELRN